MNDFFVPVSKYIYFDEAGNLLSVSNSNTQEGSYFETTYDEVKNLISGKEQFTNYVVLFDTIKKSYILKHRFNEDEIMFDINNQIYLVPRHTLDRPDLLIVQNIKDKEWQFILDSSIKDNFKNKKIAFNKSLSFSFTQYNDPHQLEYYLTLSMEQLIEGDVKLPFKSQIELDSTALSVYTIKRLDTYHHEVIQ
jgi:hypothetical protein